MKLWRRVQQALEDVAQTHPRAFRSAIVTIAALFIAAVVATAWWTRVIVTSLPDKTAIREMGSMAQATALFDAENRHAFTIYQEQRIEAPLRRISPHLVKAIIAVEDQRFYDHEGIDIVRVAGAAVANLRSGRAAQGGSTLTQQLARTSFLTSEKTLTRKMKEVVLARRIESEFDKDEILELYLNKV
jgi:membrane peptidoglycan carboxypeptidase